MTNRLKPFLVTGQRRERIFADEVRQNKIQNIEWVMRSYSRVVPEERKALLVLAEALRRLDLVFDETESRVFAMPDGIVLAITKTHSPRWLKTYLLDDECASHFAIR